MIHALDPIRFHMLELEAGEGKRISSIFSLT